jgi:hypothetical protein
VISEAVVTTGKVAKFALYEAIPPAAPPPSSTVQVTLSVMSAVEPSSTNSPAAGKAKVKTVLPSVEVIVLPDWGDTPPQADIPVPSPALVKVNPSRLIIQTASKPVTINIILRVDSCFC